MTRDLSEAQFQRKLREYGMERTGFMGYVTVWRGPHGATHIYPGNAGTNRRAQLAYLIREQSKALAEHGEVTP